MGGLGCVGEVDMVMWVSECVAVNVCLLVCKCVDTFHVVSILCARGHQCCCV